MSFHPPLRPAFGRGPESSLVANHIGTSARLGDEDTVAQAMLWFFTAAVPDTGEGGTWALTKCDPNSYMPCGQWGGANSIRNGAAPHPQFTLIEQAIREFDRDGDGVWSATERAACPWSHSNDFRRLRLIGNVSEIAAEVDASGLLSESCVEEHGQTAWLSPCGHPLTQESYCLLRAALWTRKKSVRRSEADEMLQRRSVPNRQFHPSRSRTASTRGATSSGDRSSTS